MTRVPDNDPERTTTPTPEYQVHGTEVFGPSLDLILRLHRHLQDLIFFGWQNPDRYRDDGVYPMETLPGPFGRHGAITVRDLKSMFPQFIEDLYRDAYFTPNAALAPKDPTAPAHRQTKFVGRLNAVFTDLDTYKVHPSLSPEIASGLILGLVRQGALPAPSLFSFSGRGLWCFWILRTPDSPDAAPRAYRQRRGPLELWRGVMEETHRVVADQLPNVGLDASVKDVLRFTRVPGSINTKSGRPVRYLFPTDDDGRGYLYTLGELADFFEIDTRPRIQKATRTRDRKPLEKPARGILAQWEHRLADFLKLIDHRGPRLPDGSRRRLSLFWYAFLLKQINATELEAWDQVRALAERCNPPISEGTARTQFGGGWKTAKASNARIAADLAVTEAEADALGLVHLRPDFTPKPRHKEHSTRTEDRRKALLDMLREFEERDEDPPDYRTLAAMLTEAGHKTSHNTVKRDFDSLGIAHSRARKRMRRERNLPPKLPFDEHTEGGA